MLSRILADQFKIFRFQLKYGYCLKLELAMLTRMRTVKAIHTLQLITHTRDIWLRKVMYLILFIFIVSNWAVKTPLNS